MKQTLQLASTILTVTSILTAQGVVVGTATLRQSPLDPYPLLVAPGQVLTLLIGGLNTDGLPSVSAPQTSRLPFELSGVSATIQQGNQLRPVSLIDLRVLSGCPWNRGPPGGPCATALVALTVQIPYDLQPQFGLDFKEIPAQISVKQGALPGAWVDVRVLATQARFGIQCEGHLNAPSVPCGNPLVTHADGTLVNSRQPAVAGEVVSIYMLGLGKVNPQPLAGVPAPASPLAVYPEPLDRFPLYYAFRPFYGGRPPSTAEGENAWGKIDVSFVGLSPGSIGLYQVNFTVPTPPDSLRSCSVGSSLLPLVVSGNLTLTYSDRYSSPSVGICVSPVGKSP